MLFNSRLACALLSLAALPVAVPGWCRAPRPNIIHIFADDLGKAGVGVHGQLDRAAKGLPHIKTPALDDLASHGLTFTRAYSATVCSPSRGMLYLGFNQAHNANDRNTVNPRAQDITLAQVLKQADYHTGIFGKWGFGGGSGIGTSRNKADDLRPDPGIKDPAAVPSAHGYDHFMGYLNHGRAHKYFLSSLWTTNSTGRPVAAGVSELMLGNMGPNNSNLHATYTHDVIAKHSEKFIDEHYQDDNPFFMQVNYTVPHQDLEAVKYLAGWFDAYADVDTSDWTEKEKCYAAMVTRMDASVQSLIDKLEDPNGDGDNNDSILDDTLIVFTSDNGATNADFSIEGLDHFGLLDQWRGGKRDLWEGGINVPQFVRWDGVITPGTSTDHLTDLTDFMATVADLAGVDAPVGIDGHSLVPVMTGEGTQRKRDYLLFEGHERHGGPDEDQRAPRWAIIRGNEKLIKFANGDLELYDLQSDSAERRPLDLGKSNHGKLADELESLAIKEGVERGPWYSHNYAVWAGKPGAAFDDKANWKGPESHGPSQLWSAVVNNKADTPSTIRVNNDTTFIGLEVRGDQARSTVVVPNDTKLTGTNEIRLRSGGQIRLSGGQMLSNRWIDVGDGARLTGSGKIVGDLYNRGQVAPELSAQPEGTKHAKRGPVGVFQSVAVGVDPHQPVLRVVGDFYHQAEATLEVDLGEPDHTAIGLSTDVALQVEGVITLEGTLVVRPQSLDTQRSIPKADSRYTILTSTQSIRGEFATVSLPSLPPGRRWEVEYSKYSVVLTMTTASSER